MTAQVKNICILSEALPYAQQNVATQSPLDTCFCQNVVSKSFSPHAATCLHALNTLAYDRHCTLEPATAGH